MVNLGREVVGDRLVRETGDGYEPGRGERVEGPVDRGQMDRRVMRVDASSQLVCCQVRVAGIEQLGQHCAPCGGRALPPVA